MKLKTCEMGMLVLAVLALSAPAATPAYRNPSLSVEERVSDLIARMTPEEKCAQLGLVMGCEAYERDAAGKLRVREDFAAEYLRRPVGQIYGLFRSDPWTKKDWTNGVRPEEAAELSRAVQRLAVERTRLGIPVFLVAEAPHGLMELGMPVYPFGMGLGASFDTDLMRRIGAAKGASAVARGERTIYAPIVDIARDPRWSRFEECFGELPEHVSQMALAEFQGLMSSGVDSCMKHYVCAGAADGGQHTAPVRVGANEFQNVWLRPFRRLFAAGARELMCTYNVVDGEHCSSSPYLLREVLRGQLGFRGFVNGDAGSIQMAAHGMCKDVDHAAARALKAGCDTEFDLGKVRGGDLYLGAYRRGLVTDADLDRSLRLVLSLKFEMGLFENPYAPAGDLSYIAREKELVLEAARKAMTLLKNDGTLPLKAPRRIAVIGPQAGDRVMNQLGDYTAVQRREDVVTVLDGIRRLAGEGAQVDFTLGCRVRKIDRSGFAAAEKLAAESDVTVFCMGGASSRYGVQTLKDEWAGAAVASPKGDPESDRDSGEGMDKADVRYSGVQLELFRALRAKSKKLVVVLVQGRPAVVDELLEQADAVLLAWYPGSRGGEAVAETLFGLNNPSGRLPVTFPRGSQYLPALSDRHSPRRAMYVDGDPTPLLTVGYGLSYTKFSYGKLKVAPGADALHAARLSVDVTNAGPVAGEHSVLFFASLDETDVQRPWRELVGFARVSLAPGETKPVSVDVTKEVLGRYDRNGRFVAHTGGVKYSLARP